MQTSLLPHSQNGIRILESASQSFTPLEYYLVLTVQRISVIPLIARIFTPFSNTELLTYYSAAEDTVHAGKKLPRSLLISATAIKICCLL